MKARATACANIALAKYWGKADRERNLTAVPSLSLTLDALRTTTEVEFSGRLDNDTVELDGVSADERTSARVSALLDRMRLLAGTRQRARVTSRNAFPTASGLASSASGFAALVVACNAALGLDLDEPEQSSLARRGSASAARSLFGGYVELLAGAESARPVAPGGHFPLCMLVALCTRGPKKVSSTEAMERTRTTSPYYEAWLSAAPAWFEATKKAVLERDLVTLGTAMEASTLAMHASMLAASPPVRYFEPVTVRLMQRVERLRAAGTLAYFTMDAGPHVKVLTNAAEAAMVEAALKGVDGVVQIIRSDIGAAPQQQGSP